MCELKQNWQVLTDRTVEKKKKSDNVYTQDKKSYDVQKLQNYTTTYSLPFGTLIKYFVSEGILVAQCCVSVQWYTIFVFNFVYTVEAYFK